LAAALSVLVPPGIASAQGDASGCRSLPGTGWHREVIPPAPRKHGHNAAFERSGLWRFILAGAATEGLTIEEAAKADLGPAATVYDLQRAAYDGWLVVDSWVDTYPSDALSDPVVPARVGNRAVCWRYATPAEADLDGIPGGDSYPAWYAWFSNDPARPTAHHGGVPQPGG
jgi:hypothetical protein